MRRPPRYVARIDPSPEALADRGHPRVADAARHYPRIRLEAVAAVEGEAVHRDSVGDPDADGRDLEVGAVSRDPDTGPPVDPAARYAEFMEDIDEQRLEAAHVAHDVDRLGQPQDRVADQLARPVPGDLATPVDVDHGRSVGGSLRRIRSTPRGEDRLVLEQDEGLGGVARDDSVVEAALERPGVGVFDGVIAESGQE
jgi:hypothetical protein